MRTAATHAVLCAQRMLHHAARRTGVTTPGIGMVACAGCRPSASTQAPSPTGSSNTPQSSNRAAASKNAATSPSASRRTCSTHQEEQEQIHAEDRQTGGTAVACQQTRRQVMTPVVPRKASLKTAPSRSGVAMQAAARRGTREVTVAPQDRSDAACAHEDRERKLNRTHHPRLPSVCVCKRDSMCARALWCQACTAMSA